MKNLTLLSVVLFFVLLALSCKKDNTDDRDAFIGTWTGTLNYAIPTLGTLIPRTETITIAKGASANQIIISIPGVSPSPTATVNSNTYIYTEYTITSTVGDINVTQKMNGSGTVAGNNLIETGTIIFTEGSTPYSGTWSTVFTKK